MGFTPSMVIYCRVGLAPPMDWSTLLTLKRKKPTPTISIDISEGSINELLEKQWLLTNKRGSYASSTIVGCNTLSYHGLLIGSLDPPINRIMALSNCLEMVIFGRQVFNLSTFEFYDRFAPVGFSHISEFRQDIGVHFEYNLGPANVTRSIYLLPDSDTVVLVYTFKDIDEPAEFIVRPFVGLRDFHYMQKSSAQLSATPLKDSIVVRNDSLSNCQLLLRCPDMLFENDAQWWFNFNYRANVERGQEHNEDLWSPGFFKCNIDRPCEIVFMAALDKQFKTSTIVDIDDERARLKKHREDLLKNSSLKNGDNGLLEIAADHFIVKRQTKSGQSTTILAGFPWFADWGRDAFISLPGLLLETNRIDEAKSVLTTFAAAIDKGMIPNRFDDRSDTVHFNSVDASLWFIKAAFQYLDVSGDIKTFSKDLLPAVRWIIDSYNKKTRFNIHADSDGLIMAGDSDTQLTWMDAKYDSVAFTPRYGKAVEVNALWYNALSLLVDYYSARNKKLSHQYQSMADLSGISFCKLFWNEKLGYLNDVILPDGTADSSLRPNQIFAVSLPFTPPLTFEQKHSIVKIVERKLLTPYGLRSLSSADISYRGQYSGPQYERDRAYHQGTVWAFLMGPFIEAYLKVNDYSGESIQKAQQYIQPLMDHLNNQACIGSISEIFDGDYPHKPKGCFAQAWSVGELIRIRQMLHNT